MADQPLSGPATGRAVGGARVAGGGRVDGGRAAALVARCDDDLRRSASVRLIGELTDGTVDAETFGRYLAVEHDFVRTAARLAGYCLWQQPEWSLAVRHAAAIADLVGPQEAYFAGLRAEWPIDDASTAAVLADASVLRTTVVAALAEGGYPAVVASLAAAETLYLRWCTAASALPAERPAAVQRWIDLHVTPEFATQVGFLHELLDDLPAPVTDAELDGWFRAMLIAEDAFHASPYVEVAR